MLKNLMIGILMMAGVSMAGVAGVVIHQTPDPNDHDTINGVVVTAIMITPYKDTLTSTTQWIGGTGSCYGIETPVVWSGYLSFYKEGYHFVDSRNRAVSPQYLNCTANMTLDVYAVHDSFPVGTYVWMWDSTTTEAAYTDSNQVQGVRIVYYNPDNSIYFIDSTNQLGEGFNKYFPHGWSGRVQLSKNGFTIVPAVERISWLPFTITIDRINTFKVFSYQAMIQKPNRILPTSNNQSVSAPTVFKWNKVPYATKYTLQVSTNSSFTSPLITKDTLDTTYTLPTVANTEYYWRVRTKIDTYFSEWSVDNFKTAPSTGTSITAGVTNTQLSARSGALSYNLAQTGPVQIHVYDLQGRLVMARNQTQAAGSHTIQLSYTGQVMVVFKAGTYNRTMKYFNIKVK